MSREVLESSDDVLMCLSDADEKVARVVEEREMLDTGLHETKLKLQLM